MSYSLHHPTPNYQMIEDRIMQLLVIFCFLFCILSFRVFSVSLATTLHHRGYHAPYLGTQRSPILDRNGVILAATVQTVRPAVNPTKITDPLDLAEKLHTILPHIATKHFLEILSEHKTFVWLTGYITPEQHSQINALGNQAISFHQSYTRIYPHKNLFSHTIGFTNTDGQGVAGLEKFFNKSLTTKKNTPLVLSQDVRFQFALSQALEKGMKKYQAKRATGIISKIETGEVLAMVSLPDFNPNIVAGEPQENMFNPATLGLYEIGSVFKILNTANALENSSISLNTPFSIENSMQYGHFHIKDVHHFDSSKQYGITEIFYRSSNIGSAKISLTLGEKSQINFLKKVGIASPLNLEVPETSNVKIPTHWSNALLSTMSFGYGISMTPAHLVQAVGAILNDGIFVPLSLLKVKDSTKINTTNRVISARNSEILRHLMLLNNIIGTGKKAYIPGYLIGGKTGSAEKIENGKYNTKKLVSSYLGAFPMNHPQYLIYVMLDEPQGIAENFGFAGGGWTAAPVMKDVMDHIKDFVEVTPSPEKERAYIQSLEPQLVRALMNERKVKNFVGLP